ncbi:hypothetical protein [Gluconobacter sphaericus]|uniref:Uncharacterized protein n=1 Tax=Gluconobacter sphaericus NBRC 12467 TaxID=1307951 RepID=A0AA37SG04_9PROT|nr:hypothetical protein [Gluconobacter sphaericus]MBF0885502.1 hypothetical protein [Gluconobacter sphaericus]GBR56429.1 hypothetical protein AA12467_2605 [Gluconobacter sphaericus NBRC 12467]GEB42739.1 hypothetical protein GSP01_15210 [Gluconobacter sphaericus NBRC 12467]GLQ84715.1 hypothetical protein GCM10007872_16230 [Gluconobacter sphaericus NBRC 12467]GLQ85130.1 hypothetical protein GCM10007872_20380 [Gluconobacter sphaericus NBRC 12467]
MRETANARGVSKASVPYLEMKRRQFRKAACVSLRAAGRADMAGDRAEHDLHWQRYLDGANLALDTDRQIKSQTIAGLSRIVARVLRNPTIIAGRA